MPGQIRQTVLQRDVCAPGFCRGSALEPKILVVDEVLEGRRCVVSKGNPSYRTTHLSMDNTEKKR